MTYPEPVSNLSDEKIENNFERILVEREDQII